MPPNVAIMWTYFYITGILFLAELHPNGLKSNPVCSLI